MNMQRLQEQNVSILNKQQYSIFSNKVKKLSIQIGSHKAEN